MVLRCIVSLATLLFYITSAAPDESEVKDFVLCRLCGADLVDPHYFVDRISPTSPAHANRTLFGRNYVYIQRLVNPYGARFEIVTAKRARCVGIGDWHDSHSWFPGFAWRYCICAQCGAHMGWIFEPLTADLNKDTKPSDRGFYGLILENTLSESFLSSFMVTTKFRS